MFPYNSSDHANAKPWSNDASADMTFISGFGSASDASNSGHHISTGPVIRGHQHRSTTDSGHQATGPYMDVFSYDSFGPLLPNVSSHTQGNAVAGSNHFWTKQNIGQQLAVCTDWASSITIADTVAEPKKPSWASVASQSAKPQPKFYGNYHYHHQQHHSSGSGFGTHGGRAHVKHGNVANINHVASVSNTSVPVDNRGQNYPQHQNQDNLGFEKNYSQQPHSFNRNYGTQSGRSSSKHGNVSTINQGGSASNTVVSVDNSGPTYPSHPILDKLRSENNYNPKNFDLSPPNARFFIIKSYSEDDIHRSIKYSIWCSTEHGNKRLDNAFKAQKGKGSVYLFYSVNGSGHFCGMAQMLSIVDYNSSSNVWAQDKWKGQFKVKWIYVKDLPNAQLRHIRLENNENKPVTNSRDTQEVPYEKGKTVLKIMHNYRHTTSIFDDFLHYERRQEEENQRRLVDELAAPHDVEKHPSDNSTGSPGHPLELTSSSHESNITPSTNTNRTADSSCSKLDSNSPSENNAGQSNHQTNAARGGSSEWDVTKGNRLNINRNSNNRGSLSLSPNTRDLSSRHGFGTSPAGNLKKSWVDWDDGLDWEQP